MKKPDFVPDRLYVATWHLVFGGDDFTDYCRGDARIVGMLAEHKLLRVFGNLREDTDKQTAVDLIERHPDGGRFWQVKTDRTGRVNIEPSWMKGAGRQHDPERFTKYLDSIHGIIVVDQRRLPEVAFCGVSIADIRARFGDSPKSFPTNFIYEYDGALT